MSKEERNAYMKKWSKTPKGLAVEKRRYRKRLRNLQEKTASMKYNKNRRYYSAKRTAKLRNIPFELTINDYYELAEVKQCPILGYCLDYSPVSGDGKQRHFVASLDRLDNTKGYTKDNCRIISWRANELRRNATSKELNLLAYSETPPLFPKYLKRLAP